MLERKPIEALVMSLSTGSKQRGPMEVFQAGGECVGEKLPLEGTSAFNLYNTLQERENSKKHNRAPLRIGTELT